MLSVKMSGKSGAVMSGINGAVNLPGCFRTLLKALLGPERRETTEHRRKVNREGLHKFLPFTNFFFVTQQLNSDLGRLVLRFSGHTHKHTHTHTHPVGILWTSDRPVAEAATYTTHNTRKRLTIHALNRYRTRNASSQAAADVGRNLLG